MIAHLSMGSSAPVRPLVFADMLPQKRGTEREQMRMATTGLRSASRGSTLQDGAQLDTKTAGQREARLEGNKAEWSKATGLSNGQAAAGQA